MCIIFSFFGKKYFLCVNFAGIFLNGNTAYTIEYNVTGAVDENPLRSLTCLRMNGITGEKNLIFWSLYYIEILKFRLIGGMQRNYLFSMLDKNLTIELSISTSCWVVIHVLVPVSVEGVGSISTHCYTSFFF